VSRSASTPSHASVVADPASVAANVGTARVSRLGFGAMRITGPRAWGPPEDPAAARALIRAATKLGVTFIDTADAYGPALGEQLIAEALWPYPDEIVIATKAGGVRTHDGGWQADGRPERLRQACQASLRRLRLDALPLLQLHAPDPRVPFEESLGALVQLRSEGLVRELGVCNVGIDEFQHARDAAPIASVQNRYSVGDRQNELLVDACTEAGIPFIAYRPLYVGEAEERVVEVATRHGATREQVALRWLLDRAPNLIAIPGTSSVAHLTQNMAATRVALDDEDWVKLGERARAGGRLPGEECEGPPAP
jgi:pyridoxine 4-dehydrogenase